MIAKVRLWGRTIGAVSLAPGRQVAAFEYDPQLDAAGDAVKRTRL
jgi:serine/threonine-protein kinase HipA